MSFPNSLHANAAPKHFEQIGKILQTRRFSGDYSTCDVKILLKHGFDMVHSIVVCAHSTVLSETLDVQRAPYQPFNMQDFDPDSVRRVIDWMYSGDIEIPEFSIADVLAVASFLRIAMLQRQIEQKIRNHHGSPILALNIASARSFSVMDDTMNTIVLDFAERVTALKPEDISKLSANSVIAVMAAVLPMKKKIPLINMFIAWIKETKPEKEVIDTIIQSLVISDITFDTLYAIRYSLKQYLKNLEIASKSQLTISPSGSIEIKISTKSSKKAASSHFQAATPLRNFHRTPSEISSIQRLPDPFTSKRRYHHTVSEIEDIRLLPDPFNKPYRTQSNNSILCRETNNGFPKFFTKSEVKSLQQMTDPFSISDKETKTVYKKPFGFKESDCTAKYPCWSPGIIEENKAMERQRKLQAKRSPSNIALLRSIPDPFGQPKQSDPVILRPAVGNKVSSIRPPPNVSDKKENGDLSARGVNQSFPCYSLSDTKTCLRNESPKVGAVGIFSSSTIKSARSPLPLEVTGNMIGIRKTESEIMEINALPSFESGSFRSAKPGGLSKCVFREVANLDNSQKSQKSQSQKLPKTPKSQKSEGSQKSEKKQKPKKSEDSQKSQKPGDSQKSQQSEDSQKSQKKKNQRSHYLYVN